jgi:DNA repair protein RadC
MSQPQHLMPDLIIYETQVTYTRKEIEKVNISSSADAVPFIREFFKKNVENPTVEHLGIVFLNNRNFVLGAKILSVGTHNQTLVSAKIVLTECLLHNAASFILTHNHPSGDPMPSAADSRITRQIRECSQVLDIHFFDHIVLGEKENDPIGVGHYSFRDSGVL